jgi:putative transposase
MRHMGITTVYGKPCTTQRHPAHRLYPYLLRGLDFVRPSQVWAADSTYSPMRRDFVYLCAVLE